MRNILLIRLKAIGDVIFTLPAASVLRANFPESRITFLTSKENAPLLRGFREVNEVIALDRGALRSGHPVKMTAEFIRLLHRLRARKTSLVVDFQGFGETAWMAWLTGAPHRWGSVYGRGRRWAYTRGLRRNDRLHPADWNLQLLADCGLKCAAARNKFALPDDALAEARGFLAGNRMDSARPLLVIQPFTSSAQKNWPLKNYLAVADHWAARGVQVVFLGGPADATRLQPAKQQYCVATGLPLLVSAGVVQASALMVGGDTGLGHLGVAQGKRVVMLMMHKNPGACVPYQHSDWAVVPARPGIDGISVEMVLAETNKVLAAVARV